MIVPSLSKILINKAVSKALEEDLGIAGDITTNATVDEKILARGEIISRQSGILAGLDLAEAAFNLVDPSVLFNRKKKDGEVLHPRDVVAEVSGTARGILSAERVALNFLCHLSGIASLTGSYVEAIAGTKAKIVDTRKTTPNLRVFEKYAVSCGGGQNHRAGLFDAILIKDNHIIAAGGVEAAIKKARVHSGHMIKIEIEVETLDQLNIALKNRVDAVLLDNMTVPLLQKAVELSSGHVLLEASGGINLKTVRAIAETGVDLISVGSLTHSAPSLDLGLDFKKIS